MISPESRVREIRTHGSMSGDWKCDQGSRTEARSESDGTATGPYRRRASPRPYRNQDSLWDIPRDYGAKANGELTCQMHHLVGAG